jgi:predicted DNA-binding protein
MIYSKTTSVRLPTKVQEQLENATSKLHKGKSEIIIEALEEYLMKLDEKNLVAEARRQSILASELDKEENKPWNHDTDDSGWI